jgi:hypothetical protein
VSTSQLHCIGKGHETRFSEDFDQVLTNAIGETSDPHQAASELDDVALLTVLANFAGAGPYDPDNSPNDESQGLLQIDPSTPLFRSFAWAWWRADSPMGRFVFTGRTLDPHHTVVADVVFAPAARWPTA